MSAVQDGAAWPEALDNQISEDCLGAFSTPSGQRALAYLRKITLQRTLPPEASDQALRDLEGRRTLVAIIDMRMNHARTLRATSSRPAPEPGTPTGASLTARERRAARNPRPRA